MDLMFICSPWNGKDATAPFIIQYLLCRKCCWIAAPSFGADGVIIFGKFWQFKQPEWIRCVISAEPELSTPEVMMHTVFTLSYWISAPEYNAVASMHHQSVFFSSLKSIYGPLLFFQTCGGAAAAVEAEGKSRGWHSGKTEQLWR